MLRIIAIWLLLASAVLGQVEFNGGDSYSVFPPADYASLSVGTVCFWAKYETNGDFQIVFDGDAMEASADRFALYFDVQGHFQVLSQEAGTFLAIADTDDSMSDPDTWHFYAYVNTTNGFLLLRDGYNVLPVTASVGTTNTSVFFADTTSIHGLFCGMQGFGAENVFEGLLTDARIYTRALSASELNEIYHRPWSLVDDPDLVLRTCITTNDTGDALTGTAPNYGSGADGAYSNSPTAAPWMIQMVQPQRATINID